MSATYDKNGDLVKLTCNGCGKTIGEEVIIKKGNKRAWSFQRTEDYLEAKIAVTYGPAQGQHVTCGCRKCLTNPDLSAKVLTEWVRKDMKEMDARKNEQIQAVEIVQIGIGIP